MLDELARLVPPRQEAETNEGPASGAPARGSGGPSPARSPLPGAAGAQGAPSEAWQAAGGRAGSLPQAELNRRRFEREFLSLLAQHPDLALAHAGALAQTQWHDELHAILAQSVLSTLAADPAATAAQVVAQAAQVHSLAAGVLTGGTMAEAADPADLATFLAEELGIGDAEDAVAALRSQLADPASLAPEDYEMLFESVVAMQKDLSRRRMAHKPLA